MKRSAVLNALAVLACLTASIAAVATEGRAGPQSEAARSDRSAESDGATRAGEAAPRDEPPARIVSASTVADQLLFDLCPPERVVAVTTQSASGPQAYRFRDRPTLHSLDDLEALVGLEPDIVLVSSVGDARRVARLREAGIDVLELGASTGLESLQRDIRTVARLCGVPDGGERYAEALARRMTAVAADLSADRRREGAYVSVYGGRYFGGTTGSSYHDVLEAAGLEDVAASRYSGWPQYAVEQLLELDPDVIVTRDGMRASICGHQALSRLRACRTGHVVQIDGVLLDDPGPAMLDAAEAVHQAVYDAR